ncbi:hypothetical protein MNBD_GAMMA12-1154 [hydrothermal vent metagenome]|uniref:Uncharacterized protein n=1 Tax=hydrothermal vent metagenome TaxID=652676 RepID=A0A3B0YZM0_9ZZZZ
MTNEINMINDIELATHLKCKVEDIPDFLEPDYTNEYAEISIQVTDIHIIEIGPCNFATKRETGFEALSDEIVNYLSNHHDHENYFAEYLAEFELGHKAIDRLTIAKSDYVGTVKIWCEYNYFIGTILTRPAYRFLVDQDDYEYEIFDSVKDAQDWIDKQESETYLLSNGEASRPEFYIIED